MGTGLFAQSGSPAQVEPRATFLPPNRPHPDQGKARPLLGGLNVAPGSKAGKLTKRLLHWGVLLVFQQIFSQGS